MQGRRYQLQLTRGERQGAIIDRNGNPVTNRHGTEIRGAVLDRHSIVARNFGSVALATMLARGVEQVMHPAIGGAVEYVSDFWNGPIGRVYRSMPPILNVVYADDLEAWGEQVRDYHKNIKGFDEKGRNFHALGSEAFYWAHDTFVDVNRRVAEHYNPHPFTDADREQLQLESNTWYSRYSMPMIAVPGSSEEYRQWRADMVQNKLEMTPSADRAINMLMEGKLPLHEVMPRQFRGLARTALMSVGEAARIFGIGEMSEDIRDRFNIPFSDEDQKRLDDFRGVSRLLWRVAPKPLLYNDEAYSARLREAHGKHDNLVDQAAYQGLRATVRGVKFGATTLKQTVGMANRVVDTVQETTKSLRALVA